MKRLTIRILTLAAALAALLAAGRAYAADAPSEQTDTAGETLTDEELFSEIERQASSLDLSEWQSYFEQGVGIAGGDFGSVLELLLHYAQSGTGSEPQTLWDLLAALLKNKLLRSLGTVAALTGAALVTCLAEALPQSGVRPMLSFCLGALPVLLTASAFASLCALTASCIERAAGFTEAALPVMTALLAAVGATSSAGILRPLMLFLSGTLTTFMQRVILPLIFAGGTVGILDGLGARSGLSELFKLLQKTAKWLMGLASAVYFGICAVRGMTVSAADGLSARTAKYAIDKLLPYAGGLVGGSVDAFLSCAALVKNGAGITAIIIMLGLVAEPLIALCTGMLVFRAAAALSRPAASPEAVKMLSAAADMTACLFAAAAVVGTMFAVTVLVFTAAGGAALGSL